MKGFDGYKSAEEWDPNFPDENIPYYIKRLDEFASKFEVYFKPTDYNIIFSVDDLFEFSSKGIQITTQVIRIDNIQKDEEEEGAIRVDPKIWLSE